jgi:hypothetical protein
MLCQRLGDEDSNLGWLIETQQSYRNLVTLTRHLGWPCIPQARRCFDAHPNEALALLLHPPG